MMKGHKKAQDDVAENPLAIMGAVESGGSSSGLCYFGFICCLCTACMSWIPFLCKNDFVGPKGLAYW